MGEHEKSLKTALIASFVIPGHPVGKGRPRAFRVGASIRMHTPAKTVSYESLVSAAAHGSMRGRPPTEAACEVEMDISLMVPLSWPGKKREQAFAGALLPTKKPDIDNIVKAVFDAMNGIVWNDDVQVVRLVVEKRYSETPGVIVSVRARE